MRRCFELARKGKGYVAPNPMVGAVLVHDGYVIGEGYHERFGKAHAEVNCINQAVANGFEKLIAASTLYVSLEPCAHFGKTPPCADLIVRWKIPRVVIGSPDPFPQVAGKGIEKLRAAGIETISNLLASEAAELNKRFFTFHSLHRPWVLLKWAETADGFISRGAGSSSRLRISGMLANRLVHSWRSEEASILVGTATALHDNPALTTRLWPGPSPVRLVVDRQLRLPGNLQVFDRTQPTMVFTRLHRDDEPGISYITIPDWENLPAQLLTELYKRGIQSVIVEGGAQLLQAFIQTENWDEARVITNTSLTIGQGLPSPVLVAAKEVEKKELGDDLVRYYQPD